MELIKTIENQYTGYSAKVYYNRTWAEYTVEFYFAGKYIDEADYFTNDCSDAIETAKHTLNIV